MAAEAPSPTIPSVWPKRDDLLWLSVILVGFDELKPCQRLYVYEVDPARNQISITTGNTGRDSILDIRGDYRLIMAPTPRQCWQELRRQAWPMGDLRREELDAQYGGHMPPFGIGPNIDCNSLGRS